MSVGFEKSVRLRMFFGKALHEAFGEIPYHVGSSAKSKSWRDVDVVVMLSDDIFAERFGGVIGQEGFREDQWEITCLAFSLLGKELTGLPIDFKIQSMRWANDHFPGSKDHPRSALFAIFPVSSFRFEEISK